MERKYRVDCYYPRCSKCFTNYGVLAVAADHALLSKCQMVNREIVIEIAKIPADVHRHTGNHCLYVSSNYLIHY